MTRNKLLSPVNCRKEEKIKFSAFSIIVTSIVASVIKASWILHSFFVLLLPYSLVRGFVEILILRRVTSTVISTIAKRAIRKKALVEESY